MYFDYKDYSDPNDFFNEIKKYIDKGFNNINIFTSCSITHEGFSIDVSKLCIKNGIRILFARFGTHGGLTISGIEADNQQFAPPNYPGAVYKLPHFGTSIDLISINNTFYIIGGHGYVKVS